jgi:hypothetical protein
MARETILKINPDLDIVAHHKNIKELPINFFKHFQFLVMALDNIEARYSFIYSEITSIKLASGLTSPSSMRELLVTKETSQPSSQSMPFLIKAKPDVTLANPNLRNKKSSQFAPSE